MAFFTTGFVWKNAVNLETFIRYKPPSLRGFLPVAIPKCYQGGCFAGHSLSRKTGNPYSQ